MVRTEEGSVLYLYTKFEVFESYEGSQNVKIGSRDPGQVHLTGSRGPYIGGVRRLCLYRT